MKTFHRNQVIGLTAAVAISLASAMPVIGNPADAAHARAPERAQPQQSVEPFGIEQVTLEWPMARQNPQNTGRQPNGAGNIAAPAIRWQQYLGGVPPTVVADVNGDGKPDVVSAMGGRVIARTDNGEYLWISDPIPGLGNLRAADLDGQGGADIIVTSQDGTPQARVLVLRGSTGQVTSQIGAIFGCGYSNVHTTRFSTLVISDTLPDLVMRLSTGEIGVFSFANGLDNPTRIFTGTHPNVCDTYISPVDIEGDGLPELLLNTVDGYTVWRNNSASLGSLAVTGGTALIFSLSITDTNSNGLMDVAAAHYFLYRPYVDLFDVYPATGTLVMRWSQPARALSVFSGRFSTNDNDFRVAVQLYNDGGSGRYDVTFFSAINGSRLFTLTNEFLSWANDFNNDGRFDLMTHQTTGLATAVPWRTRIYQYTGSSAPVLLELNGYQRASTWVELDGDPATKEVLFWHDADGDGRSDALVGIDLAPGVLSSAPRLYTYTFPAEVRLTGIIIATDMDGNGKVDLVVGSNDGYIDRLEVSGSQLVRREPRLVGGGQTTKPLAALWNGKIHVLAGNSRGHNMVLNAEAANLNVPPTQVLTYNTSTDPRLLMGIFDLGGSVGRGLLLQTSGMPLTLTLLNQSLTPIWSRSFTHSIYGLIPAEFPGQAKRILIRGIDYVASRHVVHVIAGDTGSTLWQRTWAIPPGNSYVLHSAGIGDMNGDGIPDAVGEDLYVTASPAAVVAFSMSDGSEVYRASLAAHHSYDWMPIISNFDNDSFSEAIFSSYPNFGLLVAHEGGTSSALFSFNDGRAIANHGALAISGTQTLLMHARSGGVLYAINIATGQPVYTKTLGALGPTPLVLNGIQTGVGEGNILSIAVANIDGVPGDEVLVGSDNGWLYALDARNPSGPASLKWAYRFYYAVQNLAIADTNNDGILDVLASVADGYLYQLRQEQFPRPAAVWDGVGQSIAFDIDFQANRTCYSARWTPVIGATGYRVVLRDQTGFIIYQTQLSDAVANRGPNLRGFDTCGLSLLSGRQYFVEVIATQGSLSSGPANSDGLTIQQTGDLATSRKTSNADNYLPGDIVTFTIHLTNSGQVAALVNLYDPIPLNTTFVPGSLSASSGTASYNVAQKRIEWVGDPGGLAPNQSAIITFAVQIDNGFTSGLIRNVAQAFETVSGQIIELERIIAVNTSNLASAAKAVDKATALFGETLSYTITVRNSGSAAASGAIVDDLLPAGLALVPGSATANLPGTINTYSQAGRTGVRWSGTLNPGQTLTFTFKAIVNVVNAIADNCAEIRDTLNGTFTRCARTVIGAGGPALGNSLKTSDRLVYANTDTITYTIQLLNDGTQAANQAVMRDVLPPSVSLLSVQATNGTLEASGNVITWTGSLLPNDPVIVTIIGEVNAPNGILKNTAWVADLAQQRVYTLTREVIVGAAPALQAEKFARPASVQPGDYITYTLLLRNTGNAVATGAVVTDPLPAHTAYVPGSASANIGTVTYNNTFQRLEWSGGVLLTMPTVISWVVQVLPTAKPGGLIVNQAQSFDGVSDHDTFLATTAVGVPAGKALIRVHVYSGTTGTTGMSGVIVSASGLNTVSGGTDSTGVRELLVDAGATPANYTVWQIVPAGFVNLTPNPVGLPGVTEGSVHDVVFRNATQAPPGFGWVRGVVFNDSNSDGVRNIFNEVGLAGISVSTSDGQTMQTNNDGSYYFLVPAGPRTVNQTNLPGWVSSTPDSVNLTVASQGEYLVNFGDWQCVGNQPMCQEPPDGYAWLFGYVYRDADATLNAPDGRMGSSDTPLGGVSVSVTVSPTNFNDTTTAEGRYAMLVPAGSGTVNYVLPSGYIALTPGSVPFSVTSGGRVRVDFGVISTTQCATGTGVVNGFVYSDTTQSGQFTLGVDEPTLTEATVSFGAFTQRTNWMYAFACVTAGSGNVSGSNPAGYTDTTPITVTVNVPSQGSAAANFGKAFQQVPIVFPNYAYVPIVLKQP